MERGYPPKLRPLRLASPLDRCRWHCFSFVKCATDPQDMSGNTRVSFLVVNNQGKLVWKQQIIQIVLYLAQQPPSETAALKREINIRTSSVLPFAREPKRTAFSTAEY